MKYEFEVAGIPKGQPRPRAFAFHGKARMYDPGTAEGWKQSVAVTARQVCPKTLDGPLSVTLKFFMPRPKSHFGKHGLKPSAPYYHAQKPDADNLAKAVLDALTTIGVWRDDAQVCELSISRNWTCEPFKPGCKVTIETLET